MTVHVYEYNTYNYTYIIIYIIYSKPDLLCHWSFHLNNYLVYKLILDFSMIICGIHIDLCSHEEYAMLD